MGAKMRDFINAGIFLLAFLAAFLCGTWAYAEVLSFQWTPNPPGTDGYKLYMDTTDTVIVDLPDRLTDTTTVTVDLAGECHNFWLRAYDATTLSGNSDIAIACPVQADPLPPVQPPIKVGGFTVTVTVEPN